jgi:GLPGLI family protein
MRNVIFVLLVFLGVPLHAQTRQRPVLKLSYTYVNVGMAERRNVSLLFRGQESLTVFSMKDSLNTGAAPNDFEVSGEDNRGRQFYKNTATGVVVFRDFVPSPKGFEPCIVPDPMKPMVWTYTAEVKRVGKYTCKAATTEFRGRKYTAWYTDDIPVSHGPWKFSGLPGAIVELHSADRNIQFTLNRVEQLPEGEISPPSGEKEIAMAEYVRRREQGLTDFISHLAAKLPRGAEISVVKSGDYNFETDFSDIEK